MEKKYKKKILEEYIYIYISEKNISERLRNCQRLVEEDQNIQN
jgi:hypothetical protein